VRRAQQAPHLIPSKLRAKINVDSLKIAASPRHQNTMGKLFTFTSDEQTDLRMLRFRLRKAIEADDAAILIEDQVPGSFHGAKYIGSLTRMEHRDTAIKELAQVELRIVRRADYCIRSEADAVI
jgi:hypothetical protein